MTNLEIKNIPVEKADFSVIDFETTGTSAQRDRVIEIGLVKLKNLKIVDTYQSLINPGVRIPSFITTLTGITNSDVSNAPCFEDIAQEINEFIGDSILAGHNLQFDHSFLKSEFEYSGRELNEFQKVCTLKLARRLYPTLKSKSLGSVRKHLKLRHRNVHRGLGDATVTAKILIKMIKVLKEDYDIETASDMIAFQSLPQSKKLFRLVKKKLLNDLINMPDNPGVYFFKNSKDEILYIGKAKSLKKRVNNYFSSNASRKAKKIVRKASRIGYEKTKTELTALVAEAQLIKKFNPELNTLLKKYSQAYFIKLRLTHNYPDVSVTTKFDFDGNDYFGPYSNRETAAKLIEIVSKTFAIRECKDKELSKQKKCYLADIERCLAPCINQMIATDYENELGKVRELLTGQNQNAVNRLLNKMKDFANQKKYEEAAEIRDTVNLILEQLSRSSILAEAVNNANVLLEITSYDNNEYVLLLEGKIFIKDFFMNDNDFFEEALNDYYENTLILRSNLENKDVEQMKIMLSWLIKNRNRVKIFYLKEYSSKSELFLEAAF